jgi:hypothetical protein
MSLTFPVRAATLELSQARPDHFDPDETVDFLADRGFDTIVCFALGYLHGETYYPSAVAPERHGLDGQDLFGEVLAAAGRRDMAVVAYVDSLFGGADAHVAHPDWTQRWATGEETTQGEAKGLCPNSPYGQRILDACVEIVDRYDVAGLYLDEVSLQSWCACGWCEERFRRDTGLDLPRSVAFGEPAFTRWLEWRSEVVAGYIDEVGRAVREARPGITYVAQHAFPLSSTAHPQLERLFWGQASGRTPPQFRGWYRPSFYGQDLPRMAESLDVVSVEPWRRFNGRPAWWLGMTVSYARAAGRGKPVLPLMEYAHFPWGLGRLSDDELDVACADVIANGGDPWFPMYAPDAADRAGWDGLRDVFEGIANIRAPGDEQVADVGVLISRRSAERFGRDDVDARYLDGLIGTLGSVREMHLPYRVLVAETLESLDPEAIGVVVVPNAACLDAREAAVLRDFVERGGGLVGLGWLATHDEAGEYRDAGLLTDVLGTGLGPDMVHAGLGYLVGPDGVRADDEPVRPVRDELPRVDPREAEVVYRVQPSWDLFEPPAEGATEAAVTRHSFGQGRVVCCGLDLGRIRLAFEGYESRDLLETLVGWVMPRGPRVRGVRLAPEVAVHAWRSPSVLRVSLVNGTSIGTTGRAAQVADQSIALDRTRLDGVPDATTPVGLRSARGRPVEVRDTDGAVELTIDRLGTWDCLVIPMAR